MESVYPYKILFVEDEEATRKNYVTYLKMLFEDVFEAEDGEEAYKIYKEKKPDIMIIDINIPKLNGLELLKKIREKDHKTKALMLTAHTDKDLLLESISLKLTKYLIKPISRKNLKEAIELTIKELKDYSILPVKKIDLPQDYYWDIELKDLRHHNCQVELTNKERSFLSLLFSQKNRVFTYDDIFEYVWGFDEEISLNSLKNMIKRLRKKLPEDTIVNVFNEGYKVSY
jgi:DNA-binding response OmpR family regulator